MLGYGSKRKVTTRGITKRRYSGREKALARRAMESYGYGQKWGGRAGKNNRPGGYIGLELKFVDESRSVTLVQNDGMAGLEVDPVTVNCIGSTAQGDGQSNRDGIKYTIVQIYVKGHVQLNAYGSASALQNKPMAMVALVQDKNTNAAQLNSEDVYDNPGAISDMCTQPLRNIQYTHRFFVHDSKTMVFNTRQATGSPTTGDIVVAGDKIPFSLLMKKKVPVHCISTLTGVSGIEDHSFHLIAAKSDSSISMTLSYTVRTRFYAR